MEKFTFVFFNIYKSRFLKGFSILPILPTYVVTCIIWDGQATFVFFCDNHKKLFSNKAQCKNYKNYFNISFFLTKTILQDIL